MPSPVYIICAHDVIEDKLTNSVSIFKVVEKVIARKGPPYEPFSLPPVTLLKAIAVWSKEGGDEGHEFESEMTINVGDEVVGRAKSDFQFTPEAELHRIIMAFPVMLAVKEDCVVTVKNRIKKSGDENWIEQSYPITWVVVEGEPATNESSD